MAGVQNSECQLGTACLEKNYKEADTEKELFQTASQAGWGLLPIHYRMNTADAPQSVPLNRR
jgi:hypothetical protein